MKVAFRHGGVMVVPGQGGAMVVPGQGGAMVVPRTIALYGGVVDPPSSSQINDMVRYVLHMYVNDDAYRVLACVPLAGVCGYLKRETLCPLSNYGN